MVIDSGRIKKRMKILGIKSWRELAKRSSISISYIYSIKDGKQCSVKTLEKISNTLGVPLAFLFPESERYSENGDFNGSVRIQAETIEQGENEEQERGKTEKKTEADKTTKKKIFTMSTAAQAFEEIMKNIAFVYPDLAIGFRDVHENWENISENDKIAIADGLMEIFCPNKKYPTRLKRSGSKGQV